MGIKDDLYDEIALRAYYQYVKRGRIDGSALDDWLDAEREVTAAHVGDGKTQPKRERRNERKLTAPAQSRM